MWNGEAYGPRYTTYLESRNIYNIQRIATNSQRKYVASNDCHGNALATPLSVASGSLRHDAALIDKPAGMGDGQKHACPASVPVIISDVGTRGGFSTFFFFVYVYFLHFLIYKKEER